jgi:hypothetical protein
MSTNAHTAATVSHIPVARPMTRNDQVVVNDGTPSRTFLVFVDPHEPATVIPPEAWQSITATTPSTAAAKAAALSGPGHHRIHIAAADSRNLHPTGSPKRCHVFRCAVGAVPAPPDDITFSSDQRHRIRVGGTIGSLDDWS